MRLPTSRLLANTALALLLGICANGAAAAAPLSGQAQAARRVSHAAPIAADPPTGQIAQGHVDAVPTGDLIVGVRDETLAAGGGTDVGGPFGFLVDEDGLLDVGGLPQAKRLKLGQAVFLPVGTYHISNPSPSTVRFRFIGTGSHDAVRGAAYEMEPLPWGPGAGAAYDVSLNREPFSGGSATGWHLHTGPAFGVLDGGTWENRQAAGATRRIPTPGYYIQPAGPVHQLAQVGSGGTALIVQFWPPGQNKSPGGAGIAAGTPTVLTVATAIATPAVTQPPAVSRQTLTPTAIALATPTGSDTPATRSSAAAGTLPGTSGMPATDTTLVPPAQVAIPTATATAGPADPAPSSGSNGSNVAVWVAVVVAILAGTGFLGTRRRTRG